MYHKGRVLSMKAQKLEENTNESGNVDFVNDFPTSPVELSRR